MKMHIMWPEGEPERALFCDSYWRDWVLAFGWSMRGKRTCRIKGNVTERDIPVVAARHAERCNLR